MTTPITASELAQFQGFVAERLGLQIREVQAEALADLLRERVVISRSWDTRAYLEALRTNAERELQAIAEAVTVGETHFFRTPDHWRAFGEAVLPALAASAAATGRPLRLLSAGCATGDEAYTMAIVVRESLSAEARAQVEILGIDVNEAFLARARDAWFSNWSLRGVPDDVCRRYFQRDGRGVRLDPAIRGMVAFEARNLMEGDPGFWRPGAFDAIFCRNVGIYLSPDALQRLIERFAGALSPGGYLFLGPAESLRGISRDFNLQHTHQTFYYRRRGGEAGAPLLDVAARPPAPRSPVVFDVDDSWVEAIRHATERISRLAVGVPRAATREATASAVGGMTEALAAFREERFGETLAILRALPLGAASDPDVLLLMAATLTNAGEIAEAEAICQRVLAADEFCAGAHYVLALCREHAGDQRTAVFHDETALYLDADFAMPHLHLALMATRAGDHDEAQAAFKRAHALLAREDPARILLFGGGFGREALQALCLTDGQQRGARP